MTTIRTALFDLDGTLIDSVRLILESYRHTEQVHGLPPRSDAEWLSGLGTPLRVQFAAHDDGNGRLETLIATYREYNLANHDRMVTAYPGVVEVVRTIRARGYRTGLVTSKNRQGAERGLRLVGLEGTMDVIIGADDVVNPKPHAEPVEKALMLLGESRERAVFIGDSVHDVHAGRAAGVRTIAVLWGPFSRDYLAPSSPDHWAEAPGELLTLLGG